MGANYSAVVGQQYQINIQPNANFFLQKILPAFGRELLPFLCSVPSRKGLIRTDIENERHLIKPPVRYTTG